MANDAVYQIGFTGDTSQLKASLESAVSALNKLGTGNFRLDDKLRSAASAALDLSVNLSKAFNQQTGRLDLLDFQNQLKKSGKTLSDYSNELSKLGPAGRNAFVQTAQAIASAQLPLMRTTQMMDKLWITMKNTMRWQLTASALNSFTGAVQTAYRYSQDLNESLNNIRIVSGKSVEEMDKFAARANQAAKNLSATTLDYTNAALIYYQQGELMIQKNVIRFLIKKSMP